ncbi:LuxR C-terminal-related transcriptional regulator [Enterobacter asburiae]
MLKWQGEETVSILMLDKNHYSCYAIKSIAEQSIGKGVIRVVHSSEELFGALSYYGHTETIIVSYDVNHSNYFILLDILIGCFPHIKIIVVIYKATNAVVSLLKCMRVEIILSYYDSRDDFVIALTCPKGEVYLSSVIMNTLKNNEPDNIADSEVFFLTPMERYVLGNLLIGVSADEIAKTKKIHIKTVNSHKMNALRKVSIKRLNELVLCS